MKSRSIDFTRGGMVRSLILFSIPIVLGELFQNFYNSVDALVVGNCVSKHALAAVSVCDGIAKLLVGFFNGMSAGVSVVVARVFGAGDREKLGSSMRVTFSFGAVLGLLLSLAGIVLSPLLLRLTAAGGEVYAQSLIYLRIYLAGLMFTVIYNIGAGVLRAVGDSETPFRILVVTCVCNIFLDLLFVAVFHWGIAGVSLATVIAQGISVLLVYRRLSAKHEGFRLSVREIPAHRDTILEVVNIGMPAGLQNSLVSFSNLFVWRYINGFDAAATAGVGVAQRLDRFIALPCKTFGLTVSTLIAQNRGAGSYDRCRKGMRQCLLLGTGVTAALCVTVYAMAGRCVGLFNSDPDVIAVGQAMMHTLIPFYLFMVVREILLGTLRGFGRTKIPMMLSLIGMVFVRQVFLAVSMSLDHNIRNVFYGYPLAWGATTLFLLIYFLRIRRKLFPE